MKVLFFHGWHSVIGGVKPTHLMNAGHEVINPALDDDDFDAAVRTAQTEYDQHKPDVIVGPVGTDHRLADPEPLKKMLEASERLGC